MPAVGLRTGGEYRAGLLDDRRLWYRGERVKDVLAEPDLRVAVDHAAIDFDFAHDPANRSLAVTSDESGDHSAFYRVPRSADDLAARAALIEAVTAAGGTVVTLIKEIGSDALFALLRVLDGEGCEKADAMLRRCRDGDLAVAVAQTDVKGDRSLPPHDQPDPDHYLHVVGESAEGIVVRGAKCHTTSSANADEVIVLPTRAMGLDDAEWAVAFAVPIDTEGLHLYVSPYGGGEHDAFELPLSGRHKLLDTLTVFDDVVVPWERVFFCRRPELAGPAALTFVEYHRFTAISYKLPLLDALVGSAAVIAEMNGVARAGHIRDKLAHLITYAETVRALTESAARRCRLDQGIAYPDPLTTNMAKFQFATGYHQALALVQECAGGLLVTGPGGDDWASPEVRPVLEKYLRAASGAEERLRMMHLISELTARDFAGYHAVLAIHAEGSVEAEKLQILRAYEAAGSTAYARKLAGLD
jgi:aromatic ring hydroxylase